MGEAGTGAGFGVSLHGGASRQPLGGAACSSVPLVPMSCPVQAAGRWQSKGWVWKATTVIHLVGPGFLTCTRAGGGHTPKRDSGLCPHFAMFSPLSWTGHLPFFSLVFLISPRSYLSCEVFAEDE